MLVRWVNPPSHKFNVFICGTLKEILEAQIHFQKVRVNEKYKEYGPLIDDYTIRTILDLPQIINS